MIKIQALRDVIDFLGCNVLQPILKQFKCSKDTDIESFLSDYALEYEEKNVARTFLVMDDTLPLQILGYFSIGLNVMQFDEKLDVKEAYEGISLYEQGYKPIYKLFMIGKNENYANHVKMSDIFNKDILGYIQQSKKYVGGNLMYIDCVPELKSYYEKLGFVYYDDLNKFELIRMIRGI